MPAPPAAVAQGANHGRQVNHDPDAGWTSTYLHCWDRTMEPIGLKFDSIRFSDLENDGSLYICVQFKDRARRFPPLQRNGTRPYNHNTVADTLGAVVKQLTRKFRNELGNNVSAFFPPDDITKLKNQIRANAQRNLIQGDDDDILKNTFPIPRELNDRNRVFEPQNIPEQKRTEAGKPVDLLHIARYLFSKNLFTKLLKVLLVHNGIGRGGEVKFVSYDSMYLDQFYGMLFLQWFQRKTLKTNPSGFAVDFSESVLCVFLAFGCFWACDDGLHRPAGMGEPDSPLERTSKFVFQDLHQMKDDSVAEQVTTILRLYIPAVVRMYYSAKSLRCGAMSLLTWDPAVTYEEAVALGGWATPSNRDFYVWQYLIALIPPALCLAGYPDVRQLPSLPTLVVLEEHPELTPEQYLTTRCADRLIDNLFHLDQPDMIPTFLKNYETGDEGRHRSLARCVCAVMIMHFEEHFEKYGSNHRYTKAVINATQQCGLESTKHFSDSVSILQKWGIIIKRRFQENSCGGNNLLGRRSVNDQIEKLNESVAKLLHNRTDVVDRLTRLNNTVIRQSEQISALSVKVDSALELAKVMLHANRQMQFKLNQILEKMGTQVAAQPEIPPEQINTRRLVEDVMNAPVNPAAVNNLLNDQGGDEAESPQRTVTPAAAATQVSPTDQQERTNPSSRKRPATTIPAMFLQQPKAKATRGAAGKGVAEMGQSLEQCLLWMYNHKGGQNFKSMALCSDAKLHLNCTDLWMAVFSGGERQKPLLEKCFKLVDSLWTSDERKQCLGIQLEDPRKFFSAISERVRKAVWVISHYQGAEEHRKKILDGKIDGNKIYKWPTKYENKLKSQIQGLGNKIGKFKLDSFVPKWGDNSVRLGQASSIPMATWVELQDAKLKAKIDSLAKNPYRKSR